MYPKSDRFETARVSVQPVFSLLLCSFSRYQQEGGAGVQPV